MINLNNGTSTLSTPIMIVGYSVSRTSRNVLHQIINRADLDVTLRPLGLRTGSLTLLCATLADAVAISNHHAGSVTITLADTLHPFQDMKYVLQPGTPLTVELDPETRVKATVALQFQEIL